VTQIDHMLESETYFRELCENLGVALIATDEDLKIRIWNAAAGRMFGAAASRMIGTEAVQAFPADRRERAERLLRRAVEDSETGEIEFQDRDSAGHVRELAAIIAPVLGDGSSRTGASICFRDITRRISLQNDLLENRKMVARRGHQHRLRRGVG
jgi:PAS domain S-box-containing protein